MLLLFVVVIKRKPPRKGGPLFGMVDVQGKFLLIIVRRVDIYLQGIFDAPPFDHDNVRLGSCTAISPLRSAIA